MAHLMGLSRRHLEVESMVAAGDGEALLVAGS
jgi:hypothetical protein